MPNPDDEDVDIAAWLAELDDRREELERRRREVSDILTTHGLVGLGEGQDEKFYMLHPSTVIPGGWQVSMFDRRGPYSHEEGQDRDAVIARALEYESLKAVRPVSEAEFMEISTSDSFREGVLRAQYVGLINKLTYHHGHEKVWPLQVEAQKASSLEEAIEILYEGSRGLE